MRQRFLVWTFALACGLVHATELPDFTELVKDSAGAVVNISTVRAPDDYGLGDDTPEWLRRFIPDHPRRPESLGSGFIISADGYVLTNFHVVEGAEEVIVSLNDRRELSADVVGLDERSDLALLKVATKESLPVVRIGSSEKLEVGEWVLAIGSPFGFHYSVTAGIVSAKGRSLPDENNENYVPFIQTDVAINPGNSGGPLFNLDGEVVGINSQIYTRTGGFMGVSFAIPVDVAMDVVEQLIATGHVSRGWLGVVIQPVDRNMAQSFGLERPSGALISRVLTDSPAARSGLVEGDIILRFDGVAVDLSTELPHIVGQVRAGSAVPVIVFREGKEEVITVELGELAARADERVSAAPAEEPGDVMLGLEVEELSSEMRDATGVEGGVRVTHVHEGPARDAELRQGDVIVSVNQQKVASVSHFKEIVETLPKGERVPIRVVRGRVVRYLSLRVPEFAP
jgi:serine protease Do